MTGKFSLSLATILPADLEQKFHAAESAGFTCVGLLLSDMIRAGQVGLAELQISQLAVSDIVALVGWADTDVATRTVAIHHAEQAFELAQAVHASVVVAAAPMRAQETHITARYFSDLCRLAGSYGVKVGLEFIGKAEQINTAAAAWAVIDLAGVANGGVVLDTFHFYHGDSTIEMLEVIPGDRIFLVQLADCLEMPKYELENRHRVYPGAGAIPLEPILAALYEKQYRGYYSLELLNDDYWKENPVTVAKDAMRALHRL